MNENKTKKTLSQFCLLVSSVHVITFCFSENITLTPKYPGTHMHNSNRLLHMMCLSTEANECSFRGNPHIDLNDQNPIQFVVLEFQMSQTD
jgi:hypothetical protein